jgi:hypothetical protein
MSIAPAGNYGNDAIDADLGTFLNCPLHAIELEDSEDERDFRGGRRLGASVGVRVKRELNPLMRNECDGTAANFFSRCDVELLPNLGAQNASKMSRMFAHQSSRVSGNLVGNPAAARHGSALSKCSR